MTLYLKKAIKDIGDNGFVSSVTIITIAFLVLMVSTYILF